MMQSATVLVVDDDDSMRVAIARLLAAGGYSCGMYPSAEALLAQGSPHGASCLVSDLRLPEMSGLELLAALQVRGGWPPLILITAHDAPGLREEAARCGAAAYLVKPFDGGALLQAVKRAIAMTGMS